MTVARHRPMGPPCRPQEPGIWTVDIGVIQDGDVSELAGGEMQTAVRPLKAADALEDLRCQTQQTQEPAHVGARHPLPAGECRGVPDRAGVDQPPPRAGASESINDPRPPGTRGPGVWPAAAEVLLG